MALHRPGDAAEVSDIVASAHLSHQSLALHGGGSKLAYGRPLVTSHVLDLSRLNSIRSYDPAELVLTAAAATPLSDIEAALASYGQMLAFEPPDWGSLLGSPGRQPTLGGIVSCNLSGPRRVHSGSARDHVLGFRAVNGRGIAFKAGGAVVKNVTGYDLSKLITGACGTLAALTEITVKVLPRPEVECSVMVGGLSDAGAIAALSKAMRSPAVVSGAAHLPPPLARRLLGSSKAVTVVRLEGLQASMKHRCTLLRGVLASDGGCDELDVQTSMKLWQQIAGVCFGEHLSDTDIVWRICAAPSVAADIVTALARDIAMEWFFDWAGGQIWIRVLDPDHEGWAQAVRAIVGRHQGAHATLVRAPESVRARIDPFQSPCPGLTALTARIKRAFDPHRVLNPARMYKWM